MCVRVCVWVCMCVRVGRTCEFRSLRRLQASYPSEAEVISSSTWVLGTKLRSPERIPHAFNCRVTLAFLRVFHCKADSSGASIVSFLGGSTKWPLYLLNGEMVVWPHGM